jgi:hypothetical protein
MSKRIACASIGLIALILMAFAGSMGRHYLSASRPDACSEQYRRCAATAGAGWLVASDCRIEIYHCRAFGEFTHPDGTVVRISAVGER